MFQSSPDPCGSGVTKSSRRAITSCCFNPRPTLAGRASRDAGRSVGELPVSILARPLRVGRLVSRIALSHRMKFLALREPSSTSPKQGAANSPTPNLEKQNQVLAFAANRPAIPRHCDPRGIAPNAPAVSLGLRGPPPAREPQPRHGARARSHCGPHRRPAYRLATCGA